jgi:alkaline phosphatase D
MSLTRLLFSFAFLAALAAGHSDAAAAHLDLGPMVGHVGPDEAKIWIKANAEARAEVEVGTDAKLKNARRFEGPKLEADADFMGHARITGLTPATSYYYRVLLDGEPATLPPHAKLTTGPADGQPTRLRFAFVSCAGREGKYAAAAWGEMEAKADADLLLMLGDNHYADTTQRQGQRAGYYSHRTVPAFRALTASTPTYAIWDDHDYGPDNSDGTAAGKEESLATFRQFWANPAYGEPDNPGVYYKFSRGNIDFFMLDGRYHRSPNHAPQDGTKTMLGARQLAWLKQQLQSSRAVLKFVASGSEWQPHGHIDSWTSFARERQEILEFIRDHEITGVVLLSGDRHFTGGYQIDQRVIEVTSGPIGSSNYASPNLPNMFLNIGQGRLFCVMDVDTRATPPTMHLEVYRAGDGIIDHRDFTWDEVNGRARLATLPVPQAETDASSLPLVYSDDFSRGSGNWARTDESAWRVFPQDGNPVYSLHRQSNYRPTYRSPLNYSLVKDTVVGDFELQVRVLTTQRNYGHRSMCLFFGYQDPDHFYYVHLGQEMDDHANQIFIVNEAPRVKISKTTTDGTPWDEKWHEVKIVRKVDSGLIEVYWDDLHNPVMTAVDKTFSWGQVGLGSFDDVGNWDDFRLRGTRTSRP